MKLVQLATAADALLKLTKYGYLPARQVFYLSRFKAELFAEIVAYEDARNSLLHKHGRSEDGVHYDIVGEEKVKAYREELAEFEAAPVKSDFCPDRIELCVQTIEETDSSLPPQKRLGFSAVDWVNIQEIFKVTEKEE